ncbi:hypothetical protein M427DRAFT_154620 [Gonapodya prolifera JEL478]|uniref:Rhodanese domain-containing protein n=1 Tax=Gonapodya prolifera (strain JEL478) TaxID=1344416 RepID=A0A139AIB6_GONPJ|nr:hypothetical protein M427DRAFT_154620 [Gonapodya prolifera JEL478]|eukprot:KXS16284.1 hypothetical protein M427DRAFT_154620 [Gonapodya prolifera JEL478]
MTRTTLLTAGILRIKTRRLFSSQESSLPREFAVMKQHQLVSLLRDPSLQIGRDFIVVDVRDPDQFAKYHVRGALNVSEGTLVGADPWEAVEILRLEALRHREQSLEMPGNRTRSSTTQQQRAQTATAEAEANAEPWPSPLPPVLVFHCNLSLIRGPKSATHILQGLHEHEQKRASLRHEGLDDAEIRDKYGIAADVVRSVNLLEGGSKAWLRVFGPGGEATEDTTDLIVLQDS